MKQVYDSLTPEQRKQLMRALGKRIEAVENRLAAGCPGGALSVSSRLVYEDVFATLPVGRWL